jgi:signal transduction histidine kinase
MVSAEFVDDSSVKESLVKDLKEMSRLTEEILEAESVGSQHFRLNREKVFASVLLDEVLMERFDTQMSRLQVFANTSLELWNCDITRVKLVIRNLVENAINHSGRVDKPVEIYLDESKEEVRIRVKDHGQGVAPEHLPHLTEAFYRTDSSRRRHTGGYGLGLYLCRLVVEAHRGKIQIQSKIAEGTSIEIIFPRELDPAI